MIPARAVVGVMIFGACMFSYMLRVNMSINLIAMVQPRTDAISGKTHVPECVALKNINGTSSSRSALTPDVSKTLTINNNSLFF